MPFPPPLAKPFFRSGHDCDLAADYGIYPGKPVVQASGGNIYSVATSYAGGGYYNAGSATK
jgi:hypothetical protein